MHNLVKLTIVAAFIINGPVITAQEVREPDSKVQTRQEGPAQFLVTCFESPQYCAEEFKQLCTDGHRVLGYFRNEFDHGQITARIACIVPQDN